MSAPMLYPLVALVVYVALGRYILSSSHARKLPFFAAINIAAVFFTMLMLSRPWTAVACLAGYILLISIQHWSLKKWALEKGRLSLIPLLLPILLLALFKIIPEIAYHKSTLTILAGFVGISYMSFRLSYLALEVRNRSVAIPSYAEYMAFAFFAPVMMVGPISRYSTFHQSIETSFATPYVDCVSRILVGITKYLFLGNMFNQLAFNGLFFDGNLHVPIDLIISCAAYYLFLYYNFSGICDVGIGTAGMLGIKVDENFDNPLLARNVKDFWNRWHISLSVFMRDMLFTPLSKSLAAMFGTRHINHAIALSIFVVFLAVGVWHGVGWNFFYFGLAHAIGVTSNHYYTIALKKVLGREGFKAYQNSRAIHALSIFITFIYVSFSFMFFANSMDNVILAIRSAA